MQDGGVEPIKKRFKSNFIIQLAENLKQDSEALLKDFIRKVLLCKRKK